jgi:hypothetical protein
MRVLNEKMWGSNSNARKQPARNTDTILTLKQEAARSLKISVNYRIVRRHISADSRSTLQVYLIFHCYNMPALNISYLRKR